MLSELNVCYSDSKNDKSVIAEKLLEINKSIYLLLRYTVSGFSIEVVYVGTQPLFAFYMESYIIYMVGIRIIR